MTAPVDICNSALIKIGVNPITSLTDTSSKAARLCNALYTPLRDAFLEETHWNCTMRRVALSELEDAPEFGFDYKYSLPLDCIKVVHLNNKDYRFKVEENRYVHTNLSTAKALIQVQVTDVSKWSAKMREAFAWIIAFNLNYSFNQNASLSDLLNNKAQKALQEARSFDGQEGFMDSFQQDEWLNARTGGVQGHALEDDYP